MKLIDVDRLLNRGAPPPEPLPVLKLIIVQPDDHRGRLGAKLRGKTIGVAVVEKAAVAAGNPVFITHSRLGRNTAFPEISVIDFCHLNFLPGGKIPDHRYSGGGRCESPETDGIPLHMGAQKPVSFKFPARIKIIVIHPLALLLHFFLNEKQKIMDIRRFSNYNRLYRFP